MVDLMPRTSYAVVHLISRMPARSCSYVFNAPHPHVQ